MECREENNNMDDYGWVRIEVSPGNSPKSRGEDPTSSEDEYSFPSPRSTSSTKSPRSPRSPRSMSPFSIGKSPRDRKMTAPVLSSPLSKPIRPTTPPNISKPEDGSEFKVNKPTHLTAPLKSWSSWTTTDSPSGSRRNKEEEQELTEEELLKLQQIREDIIGEGSLVEGPWGPRRITYSDYTGSGRSLGYVEKFLQDVAMPLYANTHTETSTTGLCSTKLREDARKLILEAVGGNVEEDVVLFTGFGASGAISKLISVLNLKIPRDLEASYGLSEYLPEEAKPVVFHGPYEHHSNILSWRESMCKVVAIRLTENGTIDLRHLKEELDKHAKYQIKIGSFSAASNVTGVLTDVSTLSILLHKYNAFAFFDYAAGGPYLPIEMNGAQNLPILQRKFSQYDYKDAVFLSPHKFVGGPDAPGILIAKRHLFRNRVPTEPAGGTVLFTQPWAHYFYKQIESREEGGTPSILGAIRASLAFQVKKEVGERLIHHMEVAYITKALNRWADHPNIAVLGNPNLPRLAICSMLIRHKRGRFLHYNFCAALFNDLFGIQCRGGCSCAGPYGHYLLDVKEGVSDIWLAECRRGYEGSKPGWFRVNFAYFMSEAVVDYIIEATLFLAEHGHLFLPLYKYDPATGVFKHHATSDSSADIIPNLFDLSQRSGGFILGSSSREEFRPLPTASEAELKGYLEAAHQMLPNLKRSYPSEIQKVKVDEQFEAARWFALPQDEAPGTILSRGNNLLCPRTNRFDPNNIQTDVYDSRENQSLLEGLSTVWDERTEAIQNQADRHKKLNVKCSGHMRKRTSGFALTKSDAFKDRYFVLENLNLSIWNREKEKDTTVPQLIVPLSEACCTVAFNDQQEPITMTLSFPVRPKIELKPSDNYADDWTRWVETFREVCKETNENDFSLGGKSGLGSPGECAPCQGGGAESIAPASENGEQKSPPFKARNGLMIGGRQ